MMMADCWNIISSAPLDDVGGGDSLFADELGSSSM
jgi:hypothetical protein